MERPFPTIYVLKDIWNSVSNFNFLFTVIVYSVSRVILSVIMTRWLNFLKKISWIFGLCHELMDLLTLWLTPIKGTNLLITWVFAIWVIAWILRMSKGELWFFSQLGIILVIIWICIAKSNVFSLVGEERTTNKRKKGSGINWEAYYSVQQVTTS